MIHSTAIVSSKSHISKNVHIGPYCNIDKDVYLDEKFILNGSVNTIS